MRTDELDTERKKIREFLSAPIRIKQELVRLNRELDRLRTENLPLAGMRGQDFSGHVASKSIGGHADFSRIFDRISEKEEKIAELSGLLLEKEKQIGAVLALLDDRKLEEALILNYTYGLKIREVAEKMHYSERSVKNFLFDGVEKLAYYYKINLKVNV